MRNRYILVTPAYNEEEMMHQLIASLLKQTVLPVKWIIVDDGSSDNTANIMKKYEKEHDFISCLSLSRDDVITYYSRRVSAVLEGIKKISDLDLEYDFVGVLDADITFIEEDFYEGLMSEFNKNDKLGITAGVYYYKNGKELRTVVKSEDSTPGSIQFFRRKCYEQIGGYTPLKFGGDDSLCDITARMHGWTTKSFKDYKVIQHREVGTGEGESIYKARFRQGLTDYNLTTDYLFMICKAFRRMFREKPFVFGGVARLIGYYYGILKREEVLVSPAVREYTKKEQRAKLRNILRTRPAKA